MPINDPEKSENMRKSIRVYSGSSNRPLAQKIAEYLGVELSGLTLKQFANGEIYARYDETVRGADVFLIQSVAGGNVNDMLMELLIPPAAPTRPPPPPTPAVITHYGYARQDRKAGPREPITARLVANLLERAGVNRIITLDLHQGQIQGFFDIPVNHLSALPLFGQYYNDMHFDTDSLVVVSPDVGRAKAAKKLSDMLGCDLAIAHKGRPRHNAAEVMGIIGDIKGKTCIINDDMIDTAGTLCANVKELKAMGAGDIYVCATHGIFSGPAIERLNDAPIVECVVTDAIPVEVGGKIKTISVAEEFAQAISAGLPRGARLHARRRRLRAVVYCASHHLRCFKGSEARFRPFFYSSSTCPGQLVQIRIYLKPQRAVRSFLSSPADAMPPKTHRFRALPLHIYPQIILGSP